MHFALQAQYSVRQRYSPFNNNGIRHVYLARAPGTCTWHVYLARVLVGDYTLGNQYMIAHPAKNARDPFDNVFAPPQSLLFSAIGNVIRNN